MIGDRSISLANHHLRVTLFSHVDMQRVQKHILNVFHCSGSVSWWCQVNWLSGELISLSFSHFFFLSSHPTMWDGGSCDPLVEASWTCLSFLYSCSSHPTMWNGGSHDPLVEAGWITYFFYLFSHPTMWNGGSCNLLVEAGWTCPFLSSCSGYPTMWNGGSHDPLVEAGWITCSFTSCSAIPRCGMVGLVTHSSRRVGCVLLFLYPCSGHPMMWDGGLHNSLIKAS